jgi:hypothetical protein
VLRVHRSPTAQALRPLVGAEVIVRTPVRLWRGRLLSCVKNSAWLVVDDDDVVVHLDDIVSIIASGEARAPVAPSPAPARFNASLHAAPVEPGTSFL